MVGKEKKAKKKVKSAPAFHKSMVLAIFSVVQYSVKFRRNVHDFSFDLERLSSYTEGFTSTTSVLSLLQHIKMQRSKSKTDIKMRYYRETSQTLLSGTYGIVAEKEVGRGYAGTVYRCVKADDNNNSNYSRKIKDNRSHLLAIKVMLKEKIKSKAAQNEIRLLQLGKGPNVLRLVSSAECLDSYLIVTEYCGRGDLHGVLGKLDNCYIMARDYLFGVACGLESLHQKLIAHCDIKMKNILISDNNVPKIADFGFAMKFSSSTDTSSVCHGTKDYWAPEMCVQFPVFNPFKADIYALGVTFVGVCEKKPIKKSHDNIYKIIKEYRDYYHRDFFGGMLNIRPEERFSLSQVKTHRWITACMTPPPTP